METASSTNTYQFYIKMIIGIDFDNTIIIYDKVFYNVALKLNFIDKNCPQNKFLIREDIRKLKDGEIKWRKVQALVYGKYIYHAEIARGFHDFINECRKLKIKIYIVSHKTKFASLDNKLINLHEPALNWLKQKGFFYYLGFKNSDVFFVETRKDKIDKIKNLECDIFVDDLIEVFLEPEFPQRIIKILYNPFKINYNYNCKNIINFSHWDDIRKFVSNRIYFR